MSADVEERAANELVRRANVLLPGMYAWAATVLYPASLHGASLPARLISGVAVAALLLGVAVARRNPSLGRALGLHGFVMLCVFSWLLLGSIIAVDRLEPTKAAVGALGWVLFAFGWGGSREPEHVPEDDPRALPGEPLAPRGKLPRGAVFVLSLAIAGASLPLLFAWRVTRPAHALFAHAVAIGCAVALVSAGADIAVRRGKWSPVEPQMRRLGNAAASLALLAVVVIVGALELLGK
ncbi:MAG TPA: hypothetical protein VHU80_16230 [Polyangiaceae bacterium]|jgi:hypothetical protein|nr:hypothetical protein [Polyangiaceae bacterium]